MRLILPLAALVMLALGACFAALNPIALSIDLYFVKLQAPTGIVLPAVLLGGWLLGGLVAWTGQVPALRRRLREAERNLAAARNGVADPP